ncbi:hypothetical protein [Kitasatospora sp. NPDC059327]|uniref:hypothetical protein n=1 Tax=Kitasatospora sp. NPDC059327 TaxID=3346803 RepID=UPI0036A44648
MSGKPTKAELLLFAGLLAFSGTVACGASSLVDPARPDLVQLIRWLFFATALMTGLNRADARLRHRETRTAPESEHDRA